MEWNGSAASDTDRVLIIPGLNGHPGMLMRAAPVLFPNWPALAFNHHLDLAEGGVEGLARRAVAVLDEYHCDERVFVCGESFGGTVALTLAHLRPERVKGLILLSTFGWHPSKLARRGAPALALWGFLGHPVGNTVHRDGGGAALPTQIRLWIPGDLFL